MLLSCGKIIRMKANAVRKCMVVANWKMNPSTLEDARKLFLDIKKETARRKRVETVIAVPFVYLTELYALVTGSRIMLGAQNVFWEKEGVYTGEISPAMLISIGASHVIVGHSERRALGETDDMVSRKVSAAIKAGLTVIVCVGESERDATGRYLNGIEAELKAACAGVPKTALSRLIIAYEPLWAISRGDGKGQTATSDDAHEMVIFIRKTLTGLYTRTIAERVRVLYGGSVNEENASILLKEGRVDGFLVGGVSLKPRAFASILTAANEVAPRMP